MTYLEVIDTAIKIGLGAVIAGIVSYFSSKQSHDLELKKISYTRRQQLLEDATEKIETYFTAWRRYTGSMSGAYKGAAPPNPDFSEAQWARIMVRDEELMTSMENLGQASARLRLLGAIEASNVFNEITRATAAFREKYIAQKATISREDLEILSTTTFDKRTEFYSVINKFYYSTPK